VADLLLGADRYVNGWFEGLRSGARAVSKDLDCWLDADVRLRCDHVLERKTIKGEAALLEHLEEEHGKVRLRLISSAGRWHAGCVVCHDGLAASKQAVSWTAAPPLRPPGGPLPEYSMQARTTTTTTIGGIHPPPGPAPRSSQIKLESWRVLARAASPEEDSAYSLVEFRYGAGGGRSGRVGYEVGWAGGPASACWALRAGCI
jgi:hypothetical protein